LLIIHHQYHRIAEFSKIDAVGVYDEAGACLFIMTYRQTLNQHKKYSCRNNKLKKKNDASTRILLVFPTSFPNPHLQDLPNLPRLRSPRPSGQEATLELQPQVLEEALRATRRGGHGHCDQFIQLTSRQRSWRRGAGCRWKVANGPMY